MAAIVYEGVGGGGDLFRGLKFFIMLRVPFRNTWVDHVESNGGEIVQLEKQADFCIADHAKKNNPAGSISWKFIEQSVTKGALEDPDDHRAGPVTHTARPVGSGGPTRHGRTPFTQQDDHFLMDWVMRGERRGMAARGNNLFIQLEEANPRHTYQSWRDRWIKYVQHQPRPSSPDVDWDASGGPRPSPPKKKGKHSIQKQVTASPKPTLRPPQTHSKQGISKTPSATARLSAKPVASSSHSVKSSSQSPLPVKSAGGTVFTKKEINLLKNEYAAIMKIDKDKELDAWISWSNAYPNHTAQEWRNYFTKEYSPILKAIREEESTKNKSIPPSKPSVAAKTTEVSSNAPKAEKNVSKSVNNRTTKPVDRDPSLTDEATFEEYLTIVADRIEDVDRITFNPTIRGKTITLFKLWKVVKADFGGNAEVTGLELWPQVANKLGFKPSELKEAGRDLRNCYDELLTDYEQARDDYYNESDDMTESQQDELLRNQLIPSHPEEESNKAVENPESDDGDDDLNAPVFSPTRPVSSKRVMAYRSSPNITSSTGSPSKRQRIDKGKGKELEIPSTPDHLLDVSRPRAKEYQSTPLKRVHVLEDEEEEQSDSDSILKPFVQPNFTGLEPRRRLAEPETQDFYFVAPEEQEAEDSEDARRQTDSYPSSPPQAITNDKSSGHEENSRVPQNEVSKQQQAIPEADPLLEYIDHHISLGYSKETVIAALEATTLGMDANLIMEDIQQGRGIPALIAGVWTAKDDEACKEEGTSGFKRIVAKHGIERVRQRQDYLREKEVSAKMRDEEVERVIPAGLL